MDSKNICHIITSLLVKYFTLITQSVFIQQIHIWLLVSRRDETYVVVAHTHTHKHMEERGRKNGRAREGKILQFGGSAVAEIKRDKEENPPDRLGCSSFPCLTLHDKYLQLQSNSGSQW